LVAARSVSELLPADFNQLGLDHVRAIVGEEGDEIAETIVLEWKSEINPAALAKAVSAFANTIGGLLIGGVEKETRRFIGWEPPGGEIELWVTNVLRRHVLPLPPFRARTLPLDEAPGRVLLLVLVPESSTTPHLLTERGAIYVRNPASSDPVPIQDQLALLELTRRGERSRDNAWSAARPVVEHEMPDESRLIYSLAVAPTGFQEDPVRRLYRPCARDLVQPVVEIFDEPDTREHLSQPEWELNRLTLTRTIQRHFSFAPPPIVVDSLEVHAHGVIRVARGWRGDPSPGGMSDPEPRGPRPLWLEDDHDGILPWLEKTLGRSRELALALGGHGDLAIAFYVATYGRGVFVAHNQATAYLHANFLTQHWSRLETDDDVLDRVATDLRRFLGLQP
jgi:hypothetical protein